MAYVLVHIAVYKRRALNVPYKIIFYIQVVNVMRACLTGGGMVNVRHQGGANELSRCALPANWLRESANKQVISSQADSLIKISRIWADFFPANTSNQP
ncbi:hypothetical protein ACSNMD_18150, partial [Klebsiella pneumoniae]